MHWDNCNLPGTSLRNGRNSFFIMSRHTQSFATRCSFTEIQTQTNDKGIVTAPRLKCSPIHSIEFDCNWINVWPNDIMAQKKSERERDEAFDAHQLMKLLLCCAFMTFNSLAHQDQVMEKENDTMEYGMCVG